jgi:hypothetical protein
VLDRKPLLPNEGEAFPSNEDFQKVADGSKFLGTSGHLLEFGANLRLEMLPKFVSKRFKKESNFAIIFGG